MTIKTEQDKYSTFPLECFIIYTPDYTKLKTENACCQELPFFLQSSKIMFWEAIFYPDNWIVLDNNSPFLYTIQDQNGKNNRLKFLKGVSS